MSKNLIKNVIFIVLLAISNILCVVFAEEYDKAYFIVNILFLNIAFVGAFFVDMLFSRRRENYINNFAMYSVAYIYLGVEIIVSLIFILLKSSLIAGIICHLIFFLVFFIYFSVLYIHSQEEQRVFSADKKKNFEKKSMIVDVEGQIGKRGNEIDVLLERLADKIRYTPIMTNKYAAKTDAKILAGVKLLCDEKTPDDEYIETIKAVEQLLNERKSLLLLTD